MFEDWPKSGKKQESVSFQEFDGKDLSDCLHEHSSFELTYVVRGSGNWQIGGSTGAFRAGSLLLCPPRTLHAWRSDLSTVDRSGVTGIVLRFSREVLPGALLKLAEMASLEALQKAYGVPLVFEVSDRERLRTRLRSVDRAQGALRLARFYVALELVSSFRYTQVVDEQLEDGRLTARERARVEELKRYLQRHFRGPVSRAAAAALVGLEEAAFSRFFRKATGTTFVDYLSSFRVRQAAALLGSRRDLSLDAVALQSGFGSLASLHRQFKKRLGTTPDSYRKAANSEPIAP